MGIWPDDGDSNVNQEIRPGYYQDDAGEWQHDRRSGKDRRKSHGDKRHDDQRSFFRRKADRDFVEREAKQAIEDALDDFAEEHGGHV